MHAIGIVFLQIEVRRNVGNPAVIRVCAIGTAEVTIAFIENHEIVVEGTIAYVMDNLQGRK